MGKNSIVFNSFSKFQTFTSDWALVEFPYIPVNCFPAKRFQTLRVTRPFHPILSLFLVGIVLLIPLTNTPQRINLCRESNPINQYEKISLWCLTELCKCYLNNNICLWYKCLKIFHFIHKKFTKLIFTDNKSHNNFLVFNSLWFKEHFFQMLIKQFCLMLITFSCFISSRGSFFSNFINRYCH